MTEQQTIYYELQILPPSPMSKNELYRLILLLIPFYFHGKN